MGSRVVLNCPVCGAEKFLDEEFLEVTNEETGETNIFCDRCARNDIDSMMESSDWSV